MSDTTSTVTLTMKVDFDLNDGCPNDITEAIETMRDAASGYGSIKEFILTSDSPLICDLAAR